MARHIESQIQRSCVRYFDYAFPEISRLLFAVPNAAKRNKVTGGILKAEGMKAGVADLILLVPKGKHASLCIEMKAGDKGKQSEYQKQWQSLAEKWGNKYVICRNVDDFMKEVKSYLLS